VFAYRLNLSDALPLVVIVVAPQANGYIIFAEEIRGILQRAIA
jgi:hypothetical protein